MFNPHAEPIRNEPVYKRIGIGELPPAKTAEQHAQEAIAMIDATLQRLIWEAVRQTAEGTNAPYVAPSEDAA